MRSTATSPIICCLARRWPSLRHRRGATSPSWRPPPTLPHTTPRWCTWRLHPLGTHGPGSLARAGYGMAELTWGVLGTGMIVRRAMLPALVRMADARVLAVASSDAVRAEECAAAFGLPRAYGSYQALLDDPAVACVYVALPNHLHAQWTVRAAKAGKHVLCEKPLAPTVAEVEEMAAACDAAGVR